MKGMILMPTDPLDSSLKYKQMIRMGTSTEQMWSLVTEQVDSGEWGFIKWIQQFLFFA